MIAATTLPRSPRLVFGAGCLARLGEEAAPLAATGPVLLVADPGIPALAHQAAEALAGAGLEVATFSDVRSDPLASQVDAAAEAARAAGARLVVGLGGGSALDTAKLAAAVAGAAAPAEHYGLCANPLPPPLPKILIPTTAGTGSEATRTAIITTAAGAKVWTWGEELLADVALLDPELTVGLPRGLTVATGVDALVHAIEAATNRRHHPLSDAPALQAIRLVRRWLPRAIEAPADLDARGSLLIASWLAGQAIDGAGTGIAHSLGHALGALAHVHHGRAVGLSLRVALAGNAEASPAAHAEVARAFGLEGEDDAALAAALAPAFDGFLRQVGLDLRLPEDQLPLDRLVGETRKPENLPMIDANCRAYDEGDLRRLGQSLLAAA